MRQTENTKMLRGGVCFAPDGTTLIHGGNDDTELSLCDLHTKKRTTGLDECPA